MELSAEQISEFKSAFAVFDKDHTGTIKVSHLTTIMSSVGLDATEAELQSFLADQKTDSTDEMDFTEFISIMSRKMRPSESDHEIQRAFSVMDTDNDGMVSAEDVKKFMAVLGENLSDEEVDEMIREADKGGSGKITVAEFTELMNAI